MNDMWMDTWMWTFYVIFVVVSVFAVPLMILTAGTWVYRYYHYYSAFNGDIDDLFKHTYTLEKAILALTRRVDVVAPTYETGMPPNK